MLVEGGFRRETPRNLLPRENKGRCRARAWLVPGAPRRPPGPGDFLLCPLEPGSVHTGTPAPHLALAETTQTVRYDITCFRAGERDRYSRLLLFLKVAGVRGSVKACSWLNESVEMIYMNDFTGTLGPAWEVVLCAAESRLPGATGLCSVTAPAGPVSGAGPVFGFMR
ncbi:unnamed protein product, partial [Rangifer tarandus platyrhynchus]